MSRNSLGVETCAATLSNEVRDERGLRIAELVEELDHLCIGREMRSHEVEPQRHQLQAHGAGIRMEPHPEEDGEESGVALDSADGEGSDAHSNSFSGEKTGRGGDLETEAWREAGRAEAFRMIESAQIQAQAYRASGTAVEEPGQGQGGSGGTKFKLQFDALGLGEGKDIQHASQPQTPRSHTNTPRQRQSPRSQDTGTPRSSGLVENAKALRAGGLASQNSPRVLPPSEEGSDRADVGSRPEFSGQSADSHGPPGNDRVAFKIEAPSGEGKAADSRPARPGFAGRLSRQRTVPKLEEADDAGVLDDDDEEEEEEEVTVETNESGSLLENRLDVLLVSEREELYCKYGNWSVRETFEAFFP